MKKIKSHTTSKTEDTAIIPFLDHLYRGKTEIAFVAIPESTGKRPDYFVESTKTLIEVKEIHDRASNQQHALWTKIASNLQKAVDANKIMYQVKGTYIVNTPVRFRSPTDKKSFDDASTQVLKAVIANEKTVNVFGVEFEINKVSDQERVVVFGSHGGGGSIDPSNVVYQNIKDKLRTANNQLASYPGSAKPAKCIVLLVNKYYFPLWDWDLFKAIVRTYSDLLSYEHIDEIWYQFETKNQGFTHKILYRKSFFEQFESSKFLNIYKDDYQLFANWFSELSDQGEEKKQKLLVALKYFLKDKKPFEIFSETQTREDIVRFGLWLSEKELFDDVVWFIKQFIDDPSPPKPEDYSGDEKFNYHQQIIENEDSHSITTVLGHLAWVVQKIALRKNYIVKSLGFTKILLDHPNLYVKLQGLIPFIEIAVRRQWLEDFDRENNTHVYKKFHNIAFDLLNKYSQYKAIANWLTHVFHYFKDLNTKEALDVLSKLSQARDAAVLFVYFGIFRERHFKDKVEFDSKPLRNKLKETILKDDEEEVDLRGSIAWNFWHILKETPDEFNTLKPYLDLFFSLPYNKRYYSSLERIIEEWIQRKPEVCIPWFITMIQKLKDYVSNNEGKARTTWTEPEEAIKFISRKKPEDLITLVGSLVELWKLGAFVGSPKTILETYKVIEDLELRATTKKKFQAWYEEMKILNPKIEIISWNE